MRRKRLRLVRTVKTGFVAHKNARLIEEGSFVAILTACNSL
jgi:hypothetical protein